MAIASISFLKKKLEYNCLTRLCWFPTAWVLISMDTVLWVVAGLSRQLQHFHFLLGNYPQVLRSSQPLWFRSGLTHLGFTGGNVNQPKPVADLLTMC